MKRTVIVLLSFVLLMLVGAGGYLVYLKTAPTPKPTTQSVPIGGPFELVNTEGETVTEKDFARRHMLIYFGYTYCPDICPVTLEIMVDAYAQLSNEVKAEVVPVFITVDPERDNVEVMKEYVGYFDPRLVGLTGSVEQIDATKKTFRVYAKKAEAEGSDDYLVDHSSFTYLIDGNSHYLTHFGHDATAEEMRVKLEELLG